MSDILDDNTEDNFRNRLKNYEEEPDDALWQGIVKGMNPIDLPLKERLEKYEEQPEDEVWTNIRRSTTLNKYVDRIKRVSYVIAVLFLSYFVYKNSIVYERNGMSSNNIDATVPDGLSDENFLLKGTDSVAQRPEARNNILPFPDSGNLKRNETLEVISGPNITDEANLQKDADDIPLSETNNAEGKKTKDYTYGNKNLLHEKGRQKIHSDERSVEEDSSTKNKPSNNTPAFVQKAGNNNDPLLLKAITEDENVNDDLDGQSIAAPTKDNTQGKQPYVRNITNDDPAKHTNEINNPINLDPSERNDNHPAFGEPNKASIAATDIYEVNSNSIHSIKTHEAKATTYTIGTFRMHKILPPNYISINESKGKSVTTKVGDSLKAFTGSGVAKEEMDKIEERQISQGNGLYALLMPTLGYNNIKPQKDDDILIESIQQLSAFSPKRLGIRVEVGYEKAINNRFSVNGGLLYFQRRQTITYNYKDINDLEIKPIIGDSMSYDINVLQQTGKFEHELKNIGILVGLNYTINRTKFIHKAGISAELHKGLAKSKVKGENDSQLYLFGNLYYRISYPLSKRFDLMLQPTFNYAMHVNAQVNAPFYVKPYGFGLNFGLFFRFNK